MSNITTDFWQQVNPVTRLDKATGFITLDAFTILSVDCPIWKGASEVATQFNYVATKNFTLKKLPIVPSNLNFVLCIRYDTANGTVARYKLWSPSPLTDTVFAPYYSGQIIKKNFTLEIWTLSTSVANGIVLSANTLFNISALKNKSSLTDADTYEDCLEVQCSTLGNTNAPVLVATPAQTNLFSWWRADTGVTTLSGTVSSWVDIVNALALVQAVNVNKPVSGTDPTINNQRTIQFGQRIIQFDTAKTLVGTNIFNGIGNPLVNHYFFVVKQQSWFINTYILQFTDTMAGTKQRIKQVTATPTVDINGDITTATMVLDTWYVVEFFNDGAGNSSYRIYNVKMQLLYTIDVPLANAPAALQSLTLNISSQIKIAELLLYSVELSTLDREQTIQYLAGRYNTVLGLPLTFASCATGAINI